MYSGVLTMLCNFFLLLSDHTDVSDFSGNSRFTIMTRWRSTYYTSFCEETVSVRCVRAGILHSTMFYFFVLSSIRPPITACYLDFVPGPQATVSDECVTGSSVCVAG